MGKNHATPKLTGHKTQAQVKETVFVRIWLLTHNGSHSSVTEVFEHKITILSLLKTARK